jgi:hypothetical protein
MVARKPAGRLLALVPILALLSAADALAASAGKGSTGDGSSADASGGGKGSQGPAATQDGAAGSPAGRVEASMLAYTASDRIAAHIATQIRDGRQVVIYDPATFAELQAYDAYATIVSTFEAAYVAARGPGRGPSSRAAATTGVAAAQTIVSTLAALRSSTEFAAQPVDLSADALIAQLAAHLSTPVIVPKILLVEPPASAPNPTPDHDCANVSYPITTQLACLLQVRAGTPPDGPDAKFVDKLFEAFFGALMGAGTSSSTADKQDAGMSIPGVSSRSAPAPAAAPAAPTGTSQASGFQLLAAIVQGRRLKLQLNPNSHLLVLEVTAAGGASRIRHNFWVELFYTTPDPAFNGGAVVTYLLINPGTSAVEKAEVLRYMVGYGKFRNAEIVTAPANF